jgi:rSAM/selenodomain-associated transferase 2
MYLRETLGHLCLTPDEELIIADGGSTDDSVKISRSFTDKVFITKTGRGRGHAMNYGAERATGEILLFLHADCVLPDRAFTIIRDTLRGNGVSAGAFDLSISHQDFRYRIIELGANLRSRVTSIPYGDQGIFLKKEYFDRLKGFADLALMEDIEFSKRLKSIGKIVFIRPPISASARRWVKEGALYTTLRDWAMVILYTFLKASPKSLKKYYKDVR